MKARCHPSRRHEARGKCRRCYTRWYEQKNRKRKNENARRWAANNPERRLAIRRKYHYGVTEGQVTQMLRSQRNRCGICRKKPKLLHVDHDHKTMKFRGMLCGNCNRGLGLFQDRALIVYKALKYLTKNG
jgi:hypothetical protein